jgi:hypothetical protein
VGGVASGSGGGFIAAWRILTEIWVGPARASGSSAPRTTAFGSVERAVRWRPQPRWMVMGRTRTTALLSLCTVSPDSTCMVQYSLRSFPLSSFLLANKFACNHYSFSFFFKCRDHYS